MWILNLIIASIAFARYIKYKYQIGDGFYTKDWKLLYEKDIHSYDVQSLKHGHLCNVFAFLIFALASWPVNPYGVVFFAILGLAFLFSGYAILSEAKEQYVHSASWADLTRRY